MTSKTAAKKLERLLLKKFGPEHMLEDKQLPYDFSGVEIDELWQYVDVLIKGSEL